jgi:hypothetical protein
VDLARGGRVARPLVAVPRAETAFFVGAFRAVDLEVLLAEDFLAEAFFADLDLGGLA